MGDFWTIDGLQEEKTKKKNKKGNGSNKPEKNNEGKKEKTSKGMTYSELLKTGANGLYVASTKIDDEDIECCIIKSKEFQYPKVAISSDAISYKDWLAKKIKNLDSDMNVNKAMYNSSVRKVDVPNKFVNQLVDKLTDSE